MGKDVVITVSRQLGSGGSYLAQRLAKRLNFKYFDREILVHLSYKLGMDIDYMQARDEKITSVIQNILKSFAMGPPDVSSIPPNVSLLNDDKLFEIQSEIIRKVAEKGNVIFVGRAAFYVLRNVDNVISIFIHANREFRIKRVVEYYKVEDRKEAEKLIDKTDRERKDYILAHTSRKWLDLTNYSFSFDSSFIGLHTIEHIICDFINKYYVNR
ncbi:MAG: cytidylate kinase-like family protein [Deferribacterota bacterium]|nr:cytidylate kinase-like family protein [Deferribacterota bacterium]